MNANHKKVNVEWCYSLIDGILSFYLLGRIFLAILSHHYSALIKFPLCILFSGILLYLYKRYTTKYLTPTASVSCFSQASKILRGLAVASVYVMLIVAILYWGNCYVPISVEFNLLGQVEGLSLFFLVALVEEVVCRGVIFRLISRRWNMVVGLIVSAFVFGFMHIYKDEVTAWYSLALSVTAGWLLGIAYAYHRTIWVPIGMHWAWNYLQGSIFGFPVPGMAFHVTPLITPSTTGTGLITGGEFGIVASTINIAIGMTISAAYTILYFKKRRIKRMKKMGYCHFNSKH